ncbi:MAG: hypothetical protein LQ346_002526 [Caloplaca aetnensis]|nr:MAG: hypothetical protein LQ346_002526 [Caloplaca aetnensis]
MASAAVAPPSNGVGLSTDPVEREAWENSQYEKIIEIRDQVFAGTHPRLKLLYPDTIKDDDSDEESVIEIRPAQISQKPGSIAQSAQASQNLVATAKNSHLAPRPPPSTHANTAYTPANAPTRGAGTSGIDPIFLTKSDVLLKAETQQKRQRIERVLADQVKDQIKEQQKLSKQKAIDKDDLPDFDVNEVLKKAQELVKPIKYADLRSANGNASASDSFDENTFYSSQMNDSTPEAGDKPEPTRKTNLTQNCKFFVRGDKCPYGEQCIYAHEPSKAQAGQGQKLQPEASSRNRADIQPPSAPQKGAATQPCNYYTQGERCPYGEHCIYSHDTATKRGAQAKKSQSEVATRNNADTQAISGPRNTGQQQTLVSDNATRQISQAERIAELEAQLRALKSEQTDKSTGPSKINTGHGQDAQEEEPIYSPPDAVPPKAIEVALGKRRDVEQQHQKAPVQTEAFSRKYPRRQDALRSPVFNEGRVVKNHITSPIAPQPARVSPLAVAKAPPIPQGQRQQRLNKNGFPEFADGTIAVQDSPGQPQPPNPRKRRRDRDSGEKVRNVIPRRSPGSPGIRIKEEPVSPPPFTESAKTWQPRRQLGDRGPIYVDEVSPRYQDQEDVVYRTRAIDRPAPRYVLDEYREPQSLTYEPDLRRVVSTRQARASLAGNERYHSPQLPPVRAASQVYVPRQEQEMPKHYRASIQPEAAPYIEHELPARPRYREAPRMMAPPPRRVVVDQHGNQFYEQEVAPMRRPRQSSAMPPIHPGPADRSFHSPAPRHSSAMISQPIEDESGYIRRGASPAQPRYVEYVSPTQARAPMSRDADMFYGSDTQSRRVGGARIVEYPHSHGARYEAIRPMEDINRVSSVRPVGQQYQGGLERVSRMQSVHPDGGRVVSLGGDVIPQGVRQMSVRPEEGYVRPVQYAQPRIQYYSGPDGRG